MRCWAYTNGFNLYNGAARRYGIKWINVLELCQQLRHADAIERVKYFTALVVATGVFNLKRTHLANAAFPDPLSDARGSFRKPDGW